MSFYFPRFAVSIIRSWKLPWVSALVGLFLLGIGLRLVGLANPPLDFAVGGQLRSATIARAFYISSLPEAPQTLKDQARHLSELSQPKFPDLLIFERLVGAGYRLAGQEILWLARVCSILFWLAGGAALFDFTSRHVSKPGGLAALGFYLLLPLGGMASRSFIGEPLLVVGLLLAIDLYDRWKSQPGGPVGWGAALFLSLSVMVSVDTLLVFLPYLLADSSQRMTHPGEPSTKKMIIRLLIFGVCIPGVFYLIGTSWVDWVSRFTYMSADLSLLLQPRFYFFWLSRLKQDFDLIYVLLALVGLVCFPKGKRIAILSLWLAYIVVAVLEPSLAIARPFVDITLIPLIAISLAPVGDFVFRKLVIENNTFFSRLSMAAIILACLGYTIYNQVNILYPDDFRIKASELVADVKGLTPGRSYTTLSSETTAQLMYYGWTPARSRQDPEDEMRLAIGHPTAKPDQLVDEIRQSGSRYLLVLSGEIKGQSDLDIYLQNQFDKELAGRYRVFDLDSGIQ